MYMYEYPLSFLKLGGIMLQNQKLKRFSLSN